MAVILAVLAKLPWKWIGLAVAVAALVFGAYHWAYDRGRESREPEIQKLTTDNATLQSNNLLLASQIDVQNKAVQDMRTEAEKRSADSAAALAQAKKDNASLAATATSLRKSAGVIHKASDPCTISPTLAGAKL